MSLTRSGAMGSAEVVSGNIDFYTLFTTLDITFVLENYGAPTLTGAGFIFKFAFEREGVHTITTLTDELHGIVLNAGTVDTKSSLNMEFTKQDLL